MPIGATISAVGGLAGSAIQSYAASNASSQQVAAQQQALAQQRAMFDIARGQLQPFINAGGGALDPLTKLLTPGSDIGALLSNMPGFKFTEDWGNKGVTAQATTRGLGGNALAEGSKFSSGLASGTYGNIVQQLQALVNTGAGSANALAGSAGTFSGQIANTFSNIGNAQAAGTLGSSNALAGGISGSTNAITNAMIFNKLFPGAGGGGVYAGPKEMA